MRVLEAHLEAALNAGAEPYLQLQYCHNSGWGWHDAPYPMFSYKLGGLEFNLTSAGTALYDAYAIRLLRGAYSHKTPHYLTSSTYYVNKIIITQKEQVEVQATIFPRGNNFKYSVNGNQTYQVIIDAICTQFGYTAVYEDPTAAFWDNIFYPAGRTLTLQSPHSFFTLLRQKLFIYAQDGNSNNLAFRQWIDDGLVGTGGHPDLETIVTFDWKKKYSLQSRTLLWRDENSTTHWYPDPIDFPNRPIYNMGYIESAAATPTCSQSWKENEDKRTFHLKYQDGDIIDCSSGDYQIKVYEVFNRKESPSLYTQFIALPKFSTTEGGPLPSTIEAAAPYTPLNVSPFVLNLNSTDNNLQALAEAVDELTCGPAIYAGIGKDPLVDADEFAVIDSETASHVVKKFTWANLKSRIFAAFAISLAAATEITAPADDDLLPVSDVSLATDAIKYFTWANLKALIIPGAWITPAFDAADFTASGAMTWTLSAGDVSTYAYHIFGKSMTVSFMLITTTVGGTLDTHLYIKIPGGKTATKAMFNPIYILDNLVRSVGRCNVAAGGTVIDCMRSDVAAWTASTNQTYIYGQITFEIN